MANVVGQPQVGIALNIFGGASKDRNPIVARTSEDQHLTRLTEIALALPEAVMAAAKALPLP